MALCSYMYLYRARCYGKRYLNDDFKSLRSISIASCTILNLVDVHGGQSAQDNKSHTHMLRAECA